MNRFITRNGNKILQYWGIKDYCITEGNFIMISVEGWHDVPEFDEADQAQPVTMFYLNPVEFGEKFADHPDYQAYLAAQQ
jgi:hypothetical protein